MDIENSEWAKRFHSESPFQLQEAISIAKTLKSVVIEQRDDHSAKGDYLWAIIPDCNPDFWLDATKTKKQAMAICREMGWKVSIKMRKVKKGETSPYWCNAIVRRMPFRDEVVRLTTVLYGFFARQSEISDIVEFWSSKRPYGNKHIAGSIAFNLGWDTERRLCKEALPDFVEREALRLHQEVGIRLRDPDNFD